MSKPTLPQGTRDFSPEIVRKRQYILNTLKQVFEQCGYQPIETPAIENLQTLMGKYGEEGDRLIFKILNNGLHEASKHESTRAALENVLSGKNDPKLTERALRYDLTIPFARFVVMHQNSLQFPFKRYQMQSVWRADRPQKGRYREFWQCDCDVVGSNALINEAELLYIYREAFHRLKMPQVVVRINSRKVLSGIAQYCDAATQLSDLTIAIDKLDKIGLEGVEKELSAKNFNQEQIKALFSLIGIKDVDTLKAMFEAKNIQEGLIGIKEIEDTLLYHQSLAEAYWSQSSLQVDFTLARGLSYYTGIIVEVNCTAPEVSMGSIGGGGRYDDLTGLFGLKNLSGVGVSFGVDRIYDLMEQLELFPKHLKTGTQIMLVNTGNENEIYALDLLKALRAEGIAAEIYPDVHKFDKQLKYIFNRNIPFALLIENDDRLHNLMRLKDFEKGTQEALSLEQLILFLKSTTSQEIY